MFNDSEMKFEDQPSKFYFIWCLIFHKQKRYERSIKCRSCGAYFRKGAE